MLWTDWSAVRAELGLDLDAGSTGADVEDLLSRAYDADLTSNSALVESAVAMQEGFGFSPATVDWELFTQSEAGASLVMRLGGGVGTDEVAASLRSLGYTEPDAADGIWSSDSTTTPVTADVTPELAFVSLDEEQGLVVASDTNAGAAAALEASTAGGSRDDVPVPAGLLAGAGAPLTAAVYSAEEACGALAMANADPSEQSVADSLLAQAGEVNPLTGFVIAEEPGGDVRVLMSFETAEQARTNADTRAKLAAGPAPGQGGDFADRFTVDGVTADGSVVTMDLAPVDDAYVVSDLSVGPVLFATC